MQYMQPCSAYSKPISLFLVAAWTVGALSCARVPCTYALQECSSHGQHMSAGIWSMECWPHASSVTHMCVLCTCGVAKVYIVCTWCTCVCMVMVCPSMCMCVCMCVLVCIDASAAS